ncbi:Kinesin-like protein kif21b [Perkinsus olseni]|uniref:Kinesin-like protein kif21b n=1 Tax=Perkinsus olseni TaxID=32597 RepID=A0A7J6MAY1_PEROL|nr:Kinesin-like protein kif21b [Perkinsus olseni]
MAAETCPILRVTLLGMGGSGKTSLVNAFVNNAAVDAHTPPTDHPTLYYKTVLSTRGCEGADQWSMVEIEDTYSSYRADGKTLSENGRMTPRNVKNFLGLKRRISDAQASIERDQVDETVLPFGLAEAPKVGRYRPVSEGRMGFMIVFDSTSQESYEEALNIALLMEETFKRKRVRVRPVVYLVANKCDLNPDSSKYQQIAHTAELFAREQGMRSWRVSAKDFRQVGKLFREMVHDISEDPDLCPRWPTQPTPEGVDTHGERPSVSVLSVMPTAGSAASSTIDSTNSSSSSSSQNINVCIRVRPLTTSETLASGGSSTCITVDGERTVCIPSLSKAYTFDRVYDQDSDQGSLYTASIEPLVNQFFAGYNCTVIAYGQTGSGKTYTMGSASYVSQDSGLIPRVIAEICRRVEEGNPDETIELTCSFIELYNEEIRDLLDPSAAVVEPTSSARSTNNGAFTSGKRGISRTVAPSDKIRIIEDPTSKNIIVIGCTEEPVECAADLHLCLDRGSVVRQTASTGMNSQSSRSHAIFTIGMVVRTHSDPPGSDDGAPAGECSYRVAKFHFVDLAGSERIKRTMATGNRMREGIHINSGLLALGNVICALSSAMEGGSSSTTTAGAAFNATDSTGGSAASGQSHIPYRDSKLTRILQDSLGGNSRTVMIACVSPAAADFAETYNTIKYASRARCITNRPVVNTDPTKKLVMELRQQIRDLTEEKLRFMGLGPGEGAEGIRIELEQWQRKYARLHGLCVERGIDPAEEGFETPSSHPGCIDEAKSSTTQRTDANNKRLMERCTSLEAQLAEYREVMAKVWARNKHLDGEISRFRGGGDSEAPPEETGLDTSSTAGDTASTSSAGQDTTDRLAKHLELDESNLSDLIGAVAEQQQEEGGEGEAEDLAGAVEALLHATSSWMDKGAEDSQGHDDDDGLKNSIAAQERHLQGLRSEHDSHAAMQQAYLEKIRMYEDMVAKANKEKEELAAQINAKKSDRKMTELLERKQRDNQRLLDQQQKEMQQLRRELSSIQKAKDRCGQEVARLEKELSVAKAEKVRIQRQRKEHDEAHRKILQDRDRVINQLKRVQAKKTLEARKDADVSTKKTLATLTVRNETLLKQLNALKEAQKRRVDSRKKSLGPAARAKQQRSRARRDGVPGTEPSSIKIWLRDMIDRQMARDGTAEIAEKLSEELDDLEKRLDSQRRYILELEAKLDDTEGLKNRRKSRERYHAELLDAQENLDSMSAQWSVMQKRYIELTDPSNRITQPGDSLKEVLSVVSSNLDAMARVFWEELLAARKQIGSLESRLTELRDQCARKESQLAEQASKMALLRNDFSRRVSELTSKRKISDLAMISKQLVEASTPLTHRRRSGVRSSDVSREGSPAPASGPCREMGRQLTPGRTEVSEIPIMNKDTPPVGEDAPQAFTTSPVSPSINDSLSFMPLRRKGMRHSLVDDIESQEVLELQSQTVYQEALLSRTRSEHIKALQDRIEELEDINVSLRRKLMTAEEERELLQRERGHSSSSVERAGSLKATKRARLAQVTRTTESADYKRSQPIRKWSTENENEGDRKNVDRPFEFSRKGSVADLRLGDREVLWGADDANAPWCCTHRERDAHDYFLTSCCLTEGPSLHLWTGSMGNIRVWDLGARPTQIKSVPIPAGGQNVIVRSMCAVDGNLVAAAVANNVKIIDKRCPSHSCCVATVVTGENKDISQVALVPSGGAGHVAIAATGLKLYDLRSFEELDRGTKRESTASEAVPQPVKLSSGHMDLFAVAASEDSKLFAGGREKTIRMWTDPTRTPTGQVFQPPHFDAVSSLQPWGPSHFVSGSRDKFIKLWEVPASISGQQDVSMRMSSRQCLASVQAHNDWITALSLVRGPRDSRLVSTGRDGIVKVWSLRGTSLQREYASRHSNGPIAGVTSCPSAEGMFVTVSHDRSFRVWKLNNSSSSSSTSSI